MLPSIIISIEYIASYEGLCDAVTAYIAAAALTAVHELGHALTAKLFFGRPVHITIGANSRAKVLTPLLRLRGLTIASLDPCIGVASDLYAPLLVPHHGNSPFKSACVLLMGPLVGGLSSLLLLIVLRKYVKKFYLTKLVALGGFLNHTIPLG